MNKRTKYRYIGNGHCKSTDPISNYRLLGACKLHTLSSSSYIRVKIPDDLELIKWECDEYSLTEDSRTISELGYDVIVKINGKWKVKNELKCIPLYRISAKMHELGYAITKENGYLPIPEYAQYLRDLELSLEKAKEDAKNYKKALDSHEICVDDLEYLDKKDILRVLKLYVQEKTGKAMV